MIAHSVNAKEIEELELETLDAIFTGHRSKVKELYTQAELLFINGNEFTRSLIANKFISPLSQLLEMNYSWGRQYLKLFPPNLNAEYRRQINASGM
jgi:hypothetical protein